jgi:hypothetical protein
VADGDVVFDLDPTNYEIRTVRQLAIVVLKDTVPCTDCDWTLTAASPFTSSDFFDSGSALEDPISGTDTIYDSRDYDAVYLQQSGFSTPSPEVLTAQVSKQTGVGDWETVSSTPFWATTEQTEGSPWGFSDVICEYPIDNRVTCSDGNNVNASKVANPIAGGGWAIRQYGLLNGGNEGARSEPGIHTQDWPVWESSTTSGTQFYMAQEMYFPEAIVGTGNYPWLSIMDFHSVRRNDGQNRYHTNPGFFIVPEGENPPGGDPMYIDVGWANNNSGGRFSQPLPVGEWFDLEVSYIWTDQFDGTIQAWINGALVYTENNVKTHKSDQQVIEFYAKLYGDDNDDEGPDGNWDPDPTIYYRRNLRASFEPMTH